MKYEKPEVAIPEIAITAIRCFFIKIGLFSDFATYGILDFRPTAPAYEADE